MNTGLYERVARVFTNQINTIFESEATLETEFHHHFEQLPFDRTNHWAGIIGFILSEAWLEAGPEVKSEPTWYDRMATLKQVHKLLDYNLFSQVLLNLQSYTGMAYQAGDAEKEIARMQVAWPKDATLDPFSPKAKMVKQAEVVNDEQRQYNTTISTLRALRIVAQFTPQISFRVSSKGQTPALADSNNLSMLGAGSDRYLKTLSDLKPFYIYWALSPAMAARQPDGSFKADGIPYLFHSRSGGEILQEALFSRRLVYDVFAAYDVTVETCILLPRMNSVLVVCDKYGIKLRQLFASLQTKYPTLELAEGFRV